MIRLDLNKKLMLLKVKLERGGIGKCFRFKEIKEI